MQHTIVLPDLGQTTSEARIVHWLKRAGDHVRRGDPVLTVETDKVDMDVESFETGYLREVLATEGEMVPALAPIAILTDTAAEPYELPVQRAVAAAETAPPPRVPEPVTAEVGRRVTAAPAARILAKELGIDLASVSGTGANGMITRADVEGFARERQG